MNHFSYKEDTLSVEGQSLAELAQNVPTPFYCYSSAALLEQFDHYRKSFQKTNTLIAYAVKANPRIALLRLLAQQGAGADIVSKGELMLCLDAHIHPQKIIYSGVGKTQEEIDYALNHNIKSINVESLEELDLICARAQALQKQPSISFRINPDIHAKTHPKTMTGTSATKFGLDIEKAKFAYNKAQQLKNIKIVGIAMHIGSQICEIEPFDKAFSSLKSFITYLKEQNVSLNHVDIGGGLGFAYRQEEKTLSISDYAACALDYFSSSGLELVCEPGRSIAAPSAVLVTRVLYNKKTPQKHFIIVDAAMNDFMRPTLYVSWHNVLPIHKNKSAAAIVDIVGPICETGDFLAKERALPPLRQGDLLAIKDVGAYGSCLGNNYNSRLRAAEILVHKGQIFTIRQRQTYENLLQQDIIDNGLMG